MSESRTEFKLKTPPQDGITNVTFSPASSQLLLVSSWDTTVRLYDISSNTQRVFYNHTMPVLGCAFKHHQMQVLSGGLDNNIIAFDINSQQKRVVGRHENAVKSVNYCSENNVIVSGSWDGSVKIWDDRSRNPCTGTYNQLDKVYTMDVVGEVLVVGTAGRKVLVWDLRNMSSPQQKRESNLKFQTRCLRVFPDKSGFAMSSIEGRVAVEFLDPVEAQKKYAFKCHRVKENGIENIYPVNAISFHKNHNTFATGGSDGFVNIWDGLSKKRLCQFHRYPTSIASLAFAMDGSVLAIASSYMYEHDIKPENVPEDSIIIRFVSDQETKPK